MISEKSRRSNTDIEFAVTNSERRQPLFNSDEVAVSGVDRGQSTLSDGRTEDAADLLNPCLVDAETV